MGEREALDVAEVTLLALRVRAAVAGAVPLAGGLGVLLPLAVPPPPSDPLAVTLGVAARAGDALPVALPAALRVTVAVALGVAVAAPVPLPRGLSECVGVGVGV